MEEFVIGLSGQLLIDDTVKNIQKQLSEIEKRLNNDLTYALQIEADLKYTDTAKNIQDSLNEIAKNLKFDIGDNALSSITKALQEIGKAMAQVSSASNNNGVVNNLKAQANAVADVNNEYGRLTKTVERFKGVTSGDPESITEYRQNGITTTATTKYTDANKDDSIVRTKNFEAERQALVKATAAANNYSAELDKVQKKYLGFTNDKGETMQATNPIANTQHLQEGQTLYDQIIKSVEELKSKTGTAFTESNSKIKEQITELKTLLDTYYKLEHAENELRTKSVTTQAQKEVETLSKLEAQWQKIGVTSSTELKNEIDGFKTVGDAIEGFKNNLNKLTDTDKTGLYTILDNVDLLKKQVESIAADNALTKFAENSLSGFSLLGDEIQKFNKELESSNLGDTTKLDEFKTRLTEISNVYNGFIQEIANKTNNGQDSSAMKDMAVAIKEKTDEIQKSLDQTKESLKEFKTSAKEAFGKKTLDIDKNTLSNQIQIWLNENTAASERTRDAMRELQKQIASVNSKSDLTLLKKQFMDLRREATATGDVGKSFFDTLKSNIAKFTGWYGIGNAISSIRREIVGAISDLKEMDTLLTEISKTSERTETELQALGKAAYSSASNYGRTVQDYLSGVLEMSRAGYSNSEAMAELSLKAQSAGDMTAELANQYLIATDAAYQLKGSEEELSNILDGQNKINIIVPLYGNIQRCSLLLSGKP